MNSRKDKAATERQLTDIDTALDTGRPVCLAALTMLARPRDAYDRDSDAVKTLFTKTIFGKLRLDTTSTGTVSATATDLAKLFADLVAVTRGRYTLTRTINSRRHRPGPHTRPRRPVQPLAAHTQR